MKCLKTLVELPMLPSLIYTTSHELSKPFPHGLNLVMLAINMGGILISAFERNELVTAASIVTIGFKLDPSGS